MSPRRAVTALVAVLAASLVILTPGRGASVAATAATAGTGTGTLSTFAGGLGEGPATSIIQSPAGLTARNGRLIVVEGGYPAPIPGGDGAMAGLVRSVDLASGDETVLAGIFAGGYRGDGGPAHSAQLDFPTDAAVDAAGNVYITDTRNHRIRKVTPAGTITTFAGNGVARFSGEGAAATSASIQSPAGIAVSPAGEVVFADAGNYRVRKVSAGGVITTIAGTGAPSGPVGDGGPATAATLGPTAVAFDPAGNLFVTDAIHQTLRRIGPDGTITTTGAPPSAATGSLALAVDGSGNVYLAADRSVVKIDPAGNSTVVAGTAAPAPPGEGSGDGGPATSAHINGVWDLALDGGNLYLSETGAGRVRRVDASGIITTVAGTPGTQYTGDGRPALAAQLREVREVQSGPTGTSIGSSYFGNVRRVDPTGVISTIFSDPDGFLSMAVDSAGNVFISGGNQVRRLTPAGTVSVFAGTGEAGWTGDGGPATLARLEGGDQMAIDGAGNLYIHEGRAGRIRRVDPSGIISTYVGGSGVAADRPITVAADTLVGGVTGMAVAPDGSLLWTQADPFGSFRVRRLTCGIVSTVTMINADRGGSIVVDGAGTVFLTVNDEVDRLNADGSLTAVAGSGGLPVVEGMSALTASLRGPIALAIHPSGRLLLGEADRVLQVDGVTAGRAIPGRPCDSPPDRPVWGTGFNGFGELGDGTTADRSRPAAASPPLTGVTAVAGGYLHSLAVRADGTVWAWGWNDFGQLGDGTTTQRLRPVPVPGLTGVVAVAGGGLHSLALKADGTVWAWGWNGYGQVGDGTIVERLRPVRVAGLTGVVGISAGLLHNLAVRSDGSVWAWGWNGAGQLGDGSIVDRRLPIRVAGLTGATGVAAGSLHSLAVRADGSVWSWGWNSFGQLGDGTTADRHLPVPVAGLGGVRTVAAGWYHSLALRTEGTVVAWGLGHVGQVDGSISSASSLVPLAVPWVTGAVAIAAGGFHSLALTTGGHVVGWGWNRFGQLATSTDFDRVGPNELDVLDHAAVIGAGAYHSLVAYRFGT